MQWNFVPCKISINNRREVEVDMEKCKKGIQNIAQNQSLKPLNVYNDKFIVKHIKIALILFL